MSAIELATGLVLILAVYLTAIAWYAIFSDGALPTRQRLAQSVLSLVVPILGPLTVLHFAHPLPARLHRLVPWPFRALVEGRPMRESAGNEEFIDDENHFNR